MATGLIVILAIIIYASGVCYSYTKILDWEWCLIKSREDYRTLFMFSLLSWIGFVIYGIVKLISNEES